jgi:hypothetical protein
VARINALNHGRSPGHTIHSSDILANEPSTTSITGKHKFAQGTGFLATSNLPPRLSSLSSSLSQPLAELVLRHRWHCTDDNGRGKVLAARLPAAISSLPCITELLGDEVSGDGAMDHLKLSSKLGSSNGISSLAALDALEVALAPFSSFWGAEGSISHRIAAINDAYQRHVTALATVASAALSPTSSSSVTADAADSAGGRTGPASIVCLQGFCASQLNAAQSAPAASTATSGHRRLHGIGRGSKSCIDDNNGTFTIVSVKYNTAQTTAAFPDLLTRCKCVVDSHSPSSQRERLCPHWNAATQTGDKTHNVVNTGVHEPIAGLSGVKGALDFAMQ